jgi:predicted DNA-binding transcriptional regulator AlpA
LPYVNKQVTIAIVHFLILTEDIMDILQKLDHLEKLIISTQKRVLTFSEALTYTGYSENTLYKLTSPKAENRIPNSKPNGKKIFIEREILETWLLRNQEKSLQQIEQEALNYTLKNKKA